jgi:hypothetical protein
MNIHGKYTRMFISWLRRIIKTTAFWLYRSILLRLIRHYQSIVNGKEEDFRERPGGLALSSELPTTQPEPLLPVTLAVPLLEAPLQSLDSQESQPGTNIQNFQIPTPGPHALDSNDTACFLNSPVPSTRVPSLPEHRILEAVGVATPLAPATPDQTHDITLTPIVPQQVNRYGRNVRVYVNSVLSESLF